MTKVSLVSYLNYDKDNKHWRVLFAMNARPVTENEYCYGSVQQTDRPTDLHCNSYDKSHQTKIPQKRDRQLVDYTAPADC